MNRTQLSPETQLLIVELERAAAFAATTQTHIQQRHRQIRRHDRSSYARSRPAEEAPAFVLRMLPRLFGLDEHGNPETARSGDGR